MPPEKLCSKCGAPVSSGVEGGFCAACLLEEGLPPGEPEQSPMSRRLFGDYELIEEIARGGMGVVFKANQRGLNRLVAVKMILSGHLASEEETQRFRAEARASAALQHPGIVAIHEVGEHDGLLYFSMDYVEGRDLAQLVRDGPWPAIRAAQCAREIADAIQYAHERGVIHRDLKPSNVLIDGHGRPHVTDFGLARQLHSEPSLTLSGQVLGSPNFMPPEQATGRHRELTPAADVYSLGALLYHLITGRAPFLADNVAATLRLVSETEPAAPRLLSPDVPRDLETICFKCLEKDPRRRYDSAQALADDLARFLRHEPIHARPIGRGEKLWRWCRRHPALAALSAVAFALLMAVASLATFAYLQSEHARRQRTEEARAGFLAEARNALAGGRPSGRFDALERLEKAASIRPGADLRNDVIAALALPGVRLIREWTNLSCLPVLDFDPNYEHYAQRNDDHVAAIHRADDDVKVGGVAGLGGPLHLVRFSPDGRWLALARGNPQRWLRIFDLTSGRFAFSEECEFDYLDFSGDSARVVIARVGGLTTLHELPSGRALASFNLAPSPSCVRLSRDGSLLASVGRTDAVARLYDSVAGHLRHALANGAEVTDAQWHPDGSTLILVTGNGDIQYWDAPSARLQRNLPLLASAVLRITLGDDGHLAATWSQDGRLRIWDMRSMTELFHAPAAMGYYSRFGREDARLAYQNPAGHLALLEINPARERRTIAVGAGIRRCAFGDDGRTLMSVGAEGVQVWDAGTGRRLDRQDTSASSSPSVQRTNGFGEMAEVTAGSNSRAFSKDRTIAASVPNRHTIRLSRPADDAELARLDSSDPAGIERLALNTDGSRLAVVTKSGALELWDLTLIRTGLARLGLDWEAEHGGGIGTPILPSRPRDP